MAGIAHFINTAATELALARWSSLLNSQPEPFPVLLYGDTRPHRFFFHSDGVIEDFSGNASYSLRVTLGEVELGPTGGTYTVTCGSSASLDYNATAGEIETALNSLSTIASEGGVTVTGTFPNFLVTWNTTGAKTAFTVSSALLVPQSTVSLVTTQTGAVGVLNQVAMVIRQAAISSQTTWATITEPENGWSGTLTTNTAGALLLLTQEGEMVGEFLQASTLLTVEVLNDSGVPVGYYQTPVILRAKNLDPSASVSPALTTYNLGDILYGKADGTLGRLPGNATATPLVLGQTGTGSASAAPSWVNPASASLPPQSGHAGEFLTTDGTNLSWAPVSGGSGITQLTGDVTAGPGSGSQAATLATVNGNVGTFGSATQSVQFTVNAKGLITAAANVTVTPAVGSITGLGSGIAAWLADPTSAKLATAVTDETGSGSLVFATSPTLVTPALGTPSALVLTNATAFPITGASAVAGLTQGDILYATSATQLAALAKSTTATRYLANTGTSNNPAWAQVDLSNGVTGDLPFANLTQIAGLSVLGVTGSSTADVAAITAGTDNQVLRRSGTSVAFGAIDISSANAVTGTLAVGSGGTGQSSYTNGQLLIGNTTGNTLTKATLTGTSNQITVTNGTGSITLSTPQDIATASTPQFERMGLGGAATAGISLFTSGTLSGSQPRGIQVQNALTVTSGSLNVYGIAITPTLALGSNNPTSYAGLYVNNPTKSGAGVPDAQYGVYIETPTSGTLNYPLYVVGGATYIGGTIELGNASDTTLARSSAGNVSIEGNVIYRAGGTDVTVADGGTGVSSLTAYAVICGGTSSTGAVQSIAGVGTSGQVLTSNGAGALPTFQNASGGWATGILFQTTTSSTVITNSTTETTIFSGTVPGGTLGTGGAVHFYITGQITNVSGAGQTFILRVKFGGTTMYAATSASLSSTSTARTFQIEGWVNPENSASAQRFGGTLAINAPVAATTGYGPLDGTPPMFYLPCFGGTATVDSSSDRTLDITMELSAADSNYSVTVHKAFAEKL